MILLITNVCIWIQQKSVYQIFESDLKLFPIHTSYVGVYSIDIKHIIWLRVDAWWELMVCI